MSDRHALFPLKSILLPGCIMDLQIFEARYLDMVSRCFKRDERFLIMPLESGPESGLGDLRFAAVGCEAQIVDWQQRDNGLLGLRIQGRRLGLPALADSQQQLGYELAFLLPFSLDQKSVLLATESPGVRLQQITEWLELLQA